MCGRFVSARKRLELLEEFGIERDRVADGPDPEPDPDYNVAPTRRIYAVMERRPRDGEAEQPPARELRLMRWGLVPSWAKDTKVGYSTFNARADGVDTRPAFRAAWKAGRRCLVVADAYYEWRAADKQPFAVALGNRGPMIFAGLWDLWRAPDGNPLKSFTIITTQANDLLNPLHDRMPVLLAPDSWAPWLGETAITDHELKAMLKPYPSENLTFWPVDRRVGNVRNDSPDLFAPLRAPV